MGRVRGASGAVLAVVVVVAVVLLPVVVLGRLVVSEDARQAQAQGVPGQTQAWYSQQRVDHFTPAAVDARTFAQRYWTIDTYWKAPDGPVILHICGEYTCEGLFPFRLWPLELARETGALVVTLEHRFFGLSQPFDDLATDKLRYLSVPQALEDLAQFTRWFQVEQINGVHGKNTTNQFFVVGGSYPGALSAWYRLKYPALSVGALASSAVINSILEYVQFDEQVAASATIHSATCAQTLRDATAAVVRNLDAKVKGAFMASELSDHDFLYLISDAVAEGFQYGHAVCPSFASVSGGSPSDQQLIEAFANYTVTVFYKAMGNSAGEYNMKTMASPTYDPLLGGRQWWWMKCSELAWFQVAPASGSIRPAQLNLTWHRDACAELFPEVEPAGFPPNVQVVNTMFGGANSSATNIIFTNGVEDPWRHASAPPSNPLRMPTGHSILVNCSRCAHCVDLYTPTDDDAPELQAARAFTLEKLKYWLATQPPIAF